MSNSYSTITGGEYIICDCGLAFASDALLREHLVAEHTVYNEFECGECHKIYATEEACQQHYNDDHNPTRFIIKNDETIKVEVLSNDYAEEENLINCVKEENIENTEYELSHENLNDYYIDQENYINQEDLNVAQEFEIKQETECDENPELEYFLASRSIPQIKVTSKPVKKQAKQNSKKQEIVNDDVDIQDVEKVGNLDAKDINVHTVNNIKGLSEKGWDREKKSMINRKHLHIVCELCGKRYGSNAALRYHQRVHTGERPYKCSVCFKTFTLPLFLQVHMRIHTGERPYVCQHCPKAFGNKAAINRHNRVHTGDKPYGCPLCNKFFTQSNSMKLHVKTVHLKMPAPYKSKKRILEKLNRMKEKEKKEVPAESDIPAHAYGIEYELKDDMVFE